MAKGKTAQPYKRKTSQHFAADDLRKVFNKVFGYAERAASKKQ